MLEMIDSSTSSYRPAVCNIGPAEIRRRRQVGWLGLAVALAMVLVLVVLDAPALVRLAVALPAAASISGFLQARMRFCAGFGMAGLQNFGAIGEERTITDEAARAADRRQALRIYAASAGGGLAAALLVAALPI